MVDLFTWVPTGGITAWLAYLQVTRPSRGECEKTHKGVESNVTSVKDNVGLRVDGLAREIKLLNENTGLRVEALADKIDGLQTSIENATAMMIKHVTRERRE